MIKEKDYPHFCYPEGKEKFEAFCRDFYIDGKGNLPRYKEYLYFREDEPNSFLQDMATKTVCDHPSIWFHNDKATDQRLYYVVFQSYGDVNTIIKEMQASKKFIQTCAENGFEVELYSNHKYEWHNKNMVTVVVRLNRHNKPIKLPNSYYVEVNIRDATPGAYQLFNFTFVDKKGKVA